MSVEALEANPQLSQAKRKLQSLSYGTKGQDPSKLLDLYDRDNSGNLDYGEFVAAVRKGGKLTSTMLEDDELRMIFDAVDMDGNGVVSIAELTSWVWPARASTGVITGAASDNRGTLQTTAGQARRRSQLEPQPARITAAQDHAKHAVDTMSGSETEDD